MWTFKCFGIKFISRFSQKISTKLCLFVIQDGPIHLVDEILSDIN